MTHPLTNKKLFKKFWDHTVDVTTEVLYTPDGIRASADWQLEQVIKWIFDNLENPRSLDDRYVVVDGKGDNLLVAINTDSIVDDLREAMRPQEDS
ncbi:MAG: hypothetical protein GY880_26135 [Planctomycetaceae bacterium]|nr:hypothetical protein [Planctomycetaceae bacterium]